MAGPVNFDGEFYVAQDGYVVVYTDGCCLGNHQSNSQARQAGVGVFFGPNHRLNLSQRVDGAWRQTNHTAEILAGYLALKTIREQSNRRHVELRTDSQFLINCMTAWLPKWKYNGWINDNDQPVMNRQELEMVEYYAAQMHVRFVHVYRDSGDPWNQYADALAKAGAAK